ncbi:hypothetical protein HHK36_022273 [Tetracentron sinense]|uniref:Protein kinase domain-containing protein n=1 Tax=Tetracentron sinense TaxID=13715 RepID=A0A835D652_TETSI|nr:hypothetical protein HHK36_022273 [Tetracentron sinense]
MNGFHQPGMGQVAGELDSGEGRSPTVVLGNGDSMATIGAEEAAVLEGDERGTNGAGWERQVGARQSAAVDGGCIRREEPRIACRLHCLAVVLDDGVASELCSYGATKPCSCWAGALDKGGGAEPIGAGGKERDSIGPTISGTDVVGADVVGLQNSGNGKLYRTILVKKFTGDFTHKVIIEWYIHEVAVASHMSNHKNVLKLLGCCLETKVPTLVYEFAASGCLSDHIYEDELSTSKKKQLLSWESKLRIATEIADAVAYLHKGTSKIIIHRYINSRTIFLDQHYVAKLFDLGFSVSIPLGETHVESDVVLGTFGFIAPESYSAGRFTEKSDVYNFGMVLIEILIGKRVFVILEEVCGVPVLDQVNSIFRWENDFSHLVHDNEKDFRLYLKANIVKGNKEQLMACAELAIKCIKVNPEERPSMMEAAKELRRIRRFQVDSL